MQTSRLLELFSLEGKVALVTGASGDIGRALAQGLAAAGATVALSGRSPEKLERTRAAIADAGGTAAVFPADLSEPEAPAALAERVAQQMGRIDVLVNCAGMNRRQPIAEVTAANYAAIMDANLRSAYFLSQAALPHLIAQGGGKIINIGSLTVAVGLADVSVYGMTKSALAQLTKTMAVEWAQHNIQVNCLCPGFIATELTVPLFANQRRRAWILERTPLGRPGTPDDLVGMAIFLASRASDFMTGQTVFVDGGFTAGSMW
ncbi:MAG: glucose 1-dehydrogenase [Chloroflexota bacterium]|nr:MAG: dehydrogenase [Chloroflexota bacterium]